MPAGSAPSLAAVEAITAVADPVIRNLQITQCYHELSAALAARTGSSANWCTFATWASKQAGVTIRKEDLARALADALRARAAAQVEAQALGTRAAAPTRAPLLEHLNPLAAFDRASDAVARGNLKVFAEIGRAFARFCATCLDDPAFDAGRLAQFSETFQPGEPPDGQAYLRQAFAGYYQALFEPDPKARHELLLLANLLIGCHEQTRLQPEIQAALEAPLPSADVFKRQLAAVLFRQGDWLALVRWLWALVLRRPTPLDEALALWAAGLQQEVRRVTTECLMTLELPAGPLRLGADLPAGFPADLEHLQNRDLLALLGRIDPTPDSVRGSGAADWADLPQRLHFIVDLFRCYAETADLFRPPFTPEQTAALTAGRRPAGRL